VHGTNALMIRWCVNFCSFGSRSGVKNVETHASMFRKTVYLAKICLGTLMSSIRYVRHNYLLYSMFSNILYLANVCSGTPLSSK